MRLKLHSLAQGREARAKRGRANMTGAFAWRMTTAQRGAGDMFHAPHRVQAFYLWLFIARGAASWVRRWQGWRVA